MRNTFTFVILVSISCAAALGEEKKLASGPTLGTMPRVFYVKDVTGKHATEVKTCYRCNYGSRPVVGVFAKQLDADTAKLLQGLDKTIAAHLKSEKNAARQMAGVFVMVTDDPDAAEAKLRRLQKNLNLKHVPLTVFDGLDGPVGYRLSKDAAVTVSMWNKSDVKANLAFKNGKELKDDAIKKVLVTTQKIAPVKKNDTPGK